MKKKERKANLVPNRGQKSTLIEITHKEEPYMEAQTESWIERFLTYITVLMVQYLNIINIGSRRLLILCRKYQASWESTEIRNSQHTIKC